MMDLDRMYMPRRESESIANSNMAYEAEVATAPASVEDEVYVTVDAIDGGKNSFGPCPWTPRVDDAVALVMPAIGDRALVVISEDGDPWVVAWWPS